MRECSEQGEFCVVPGSTRDSTPGRLRPSSTGHTAAANRERILAFQHVKASPPPLIPAEAGTQFCPGRVKDWVPASAGTSGMGGPSIISSGAYGSLLSQRRLRVVGRE